MASAGYLFPDYLELHHREAGYSDFLRIFYSSDLEKRDFFDTPVEDRLSGFQDRWLVFASNVGQKLLFRLRNLMAVMGTTVENWLNYPTFNGNVERPDSLSATFRSMIGSLDEHLELDSDIKLNDERYRPALSVMAAKLAYENEAFVSTVVKDHWKMEFLGFFNFGLVIMFQDKKVDPDLIMVAFRGTSPFDADDWITDLNLSWYEIEGVGRLHAGFQKALGLQKDMGCPKEIESISGPKQFAYYTIRKNLRDILSRNKNTK